MEQPSANRIAYWDNLKGIFIFFVVFAHCLYALQDSAVVNTAVDMIYMFHMPAFVFIAGFLSKSEKSRGKDALFRLGAAYVIFNSIMALYAFGRYGTLPSFVTPSYSYWFLPALMIWRLTAKYFSRLRGAVLLAGIASLAVGFLPDVTNVFGAARAVAFYPFFLAGYMLSKEKVSRLYGKRRAIIYAEGALLLALGAVAAFLLSRAAILSDADLVMSAYESVVGAIKRAVIFAVAAVIIAGFMLAVPDRKIPGITTLGKNSMTVFLLHRIPTLMFSDLLADCSDTAIFLTAFAASAVIVLIFSADAVSSRVNGALIHSADILSGKANPGDTRARVQKGVVFVLVLSLAAISVMGGIVSLGKSDSVSSVTADAMYTKITAEQQAQFDDDVKLLFVGDLILLEDQVKNAYDGAKYSFDNIFEYTKEYISDADLAIGVFEGPTAGESAGYSVGNFDDGKALSVNYPDEFAQAIKTAGFDLVTTATNHLLDRGEQGAMRTLDVLDECGLEHIGSYRNDSEKQAVKLIDVQGIKIAALAYTFGSNGYTESQLLADDRAYMTSLLVSPQSENFDSVKQSVTRDIERARAEKPDILLVVSHMGEQFLDEPDDYQRTWNDIFLSAGVDVVLNDHAHCVQPVEVARGDKGSSIVVNCPGNFVNIYREHNGDKSAMVEVYIDKNEKTITGASIVPMWISSPINGNYRPAPIYNILHDESLRSTVSTDDLKLIEQAFSHITSVMLGEEMSLDMVSERLYMNESGFLAPAVQELSFAEKATKSALYEAIASAKSVCFVGDSITQGTKNGGYGWHEPLSGISKNVTACARGGGTTKSILPLVETQSELYVVALGTNDVRYRDETCAMTQQEYINELDGFVKRIRKERQDARFAFIAPWLAQENDAANALTVKQRDELMEQYTVALEKWCGENGHIFSDPNGQIAAVLEKEPVSRYLIDYIHPNRTNGIELYCKAALECSKR